MNDKKIVYTLVQLYVLKRELEKRMGWIIEIIRDFDDLMWDFPGWGAGFKQYESSIERLDRSFVHIFEITNEILQEVNRQILVREGATLMRVESSHTVTPPRWMDILRGTEQGKPFTQVGLQHWSERADHVTWWIYTELKYGEEDLTQLLYQKRRGVLYDPTIVSYLSRLMESWSSSRDMLIDFRHETEDYIKIMKRLAPIEEDVL